MKYISGGDATRPQATGKKLIIHCCNDIGAWGAGFVMALSKQWPKPEIEYRKWFANPPKNRPFALGFIQPVNVEPDIAVINMIAQENTGPNEYGFPPIRYYALDECLKAVAVVAKTYRCSVHVPYLMGCALAGGEWDYVELMLNKRLADEGIDVIVYDFEGKRDEG
jgi:hypothetical protein